MGGFRSNKVKDSEKRRRAKEILSSMFCNSYTWMDDDSLTDGMDEAEIEAVSEQLESYIETICKRYKI